jgi:hypothetical protein
MEADMAGVNRIAAVQWITPPIVVPALIVLAVLVMWLKI